MPGNARVSDLLNLHANMSRRVRNLETGVHPVTATDYYDSTDWQTVALTTTAFDNHSWRWRQRVGIVTMDGGVTEHTAGAFAAISSGGHTLATLPTEARPSVDLYVRVIVTGGTAHSTIARIQTDGDVILFNQTGGSAAGPFYFDGTTYTPI